MKTDSKANRKWKSRIKYLAGILALTATVVLALVLPDLYSGWQDRKLLDQVALSTREEIHFLDTDALDISARLKMQAETVDFYYTQGMAFSYTYEGKQDPELEELLEKCRASLKKWSEYGLLPARLEDMVQASENTVAAYYYVQIDAGMIPVVVMCFQENPFLQVVMDADNGFLYYVGCAGDDTARYILQCMGVSDEDDLDKKMYDNRFSLDQIQDPSGYWFADLAGADSQRITASDYTGIFLDVELQYGDFTGKAYRRMFEHYAASPGLAVMFGNRNWSYLAMDIVALYFGESDWMLSVENWIDSWNETAAAAGRTDLMQDMDTSEFEENQLSENEEESVIIDGVIPGKDVYDIQEEISR